MNRSLVKLTSSDEVIEDDRTILLNSSGSLNVYFDEGLPKSVSNVSILSKLNNFDDFCSDDEDDLGLVPVNLLDET